MRDTKQPEATAIQGNLPKQPEGSFRAAPAIGVDFDFEGTACSHKAPLWLFLLVIGVCNAFWLYPVAGCTLIALYINVPLGMHGDGDIGADSYLAQQSKYEDLRVALYTLVLIHLVLASCTIVGICMKITRPWPRVLINIQAVVVAVLVIIEVILQTAKSDSMSMPLALPAAAFISASFYFALLILYWKGSLI
jgi:hypothetical protein